MNLFRVNCFGYSTLLLSVAVLQGCSAESASISKTQKSLGTDLPKVAAFVEDFRMRNGALPNSIILDKWLKDQQFNLLHYTEGLGMPLGIIDASLECDRGAQHQDKCMYKISYDHDAGLFVDNYWYEVPTGATNLQIPEAALIISHD